MKLLSERDEICDDFFALSIKINGATNVCVCRAFFNFNMSVKD